MLFCDVHHCYVDYKKEDVCLHSDLEFWMQPIAKDDHIDKFGRVGHILHRKQTMVRRSRWGAP